MGLKKKLSKALSLLLLEFNAINDYAKFKKFYTKTTSFKNSKDEVGSWILQDKHRIEKALSLPSPRLGFGKEVLIRLSKNLVLYKEIGSKDEVYYIGIGAIKAYEEFHKSKGFNELELVHDIMSNFPLEDFIHRDCDKVGYFKPEKISCEDGEAFRRISHRRYSCRNFDQGRNQDINDELLNSIVEIAIKAPSVCNRQHWRVHFFSGDLKDKVLSFQNGNTGMDNIPFIALITSDIKYFYSENERNQPYTDGGIFSMNFMYSLQSFGLESCPLNWCNTFLNERRFNKLSLIPESEVVVMAIAFGFPNIDAFYAKSPRLDVKNFYTKH